MGAGVAVSTGPEQPESINPQTASSSIFLPCRGRWGPEFGALPGGSERSFIKVSFIVSKTGRIFA